MKSEASTADRTSAAVNAQSDLRTVMRNFATGVCIVTTFFDASSGRRHNAITANSLTSVSLDPPLVSLSIRGDSGFLADLMDSRVWATSILDADAADLARIFAGPEQERRRALGGLPTETGTQTGAQLLDGLAWMECRYRDHLVTGDHVMVIGDVVGLGVRGSGSPLIFVQGGFHRMRTSTGD
ncbi:flavin reductase family protein [Streptomyces sp. NPDC000410]|uniref:flavin reductase family protein n=1 Tax=Streptomyces sp. NPDC000410 TaxID=3154254 RepID=UPI003323A453